MKETRLLWSAEYLLKKNLKKMLMLRYRCNDPYTFQIFRKTQEFTSDISDKVMPVYTKPFRHDQSINLKGLLCKFKINISLNVTAYRDQTYCLRMRSSCGPTLLFVSHKSLQLNLNSCSSLQINEEMNK